MTTSTSAAASAAFRRRAPTPTAPRRVLIAVALLLAAGAALYGGLSAAHHPGARAAHRRAAAHSQGLLSLPAAAQGPVSRALGADSPAYRVTPSWAGFAASNTAQRLRVRFDLGGVSVSSGATRVSLGLRAIGYGGSLASVPAVAPRARANRITYQHPGLGEWYANGPLGLEQGFTITHAPPVRAAGALTLAMGLSGGAHVSLGPGAQSLTLRGPAGPALRYSGLAATDATGRALHGWLGVEGGRLLLRVDTSHARYPVRIDPFVQQGEKLTGAGARGEAGEFGYSVAISPDGNTALVGGPSDNGGVGAAWIFTRASEKWTQQGAKLTGKEESGTGEFGRSVALSETGTYAVIGAPSDNEHLGAAWVFLRSGEKWTQQGPKLTGGKEETGEAQFGRSVAVASKEGNYVLIGGSEDNGAGTHAGAGWVFLRSGTTWSFQAKLTGKEEVGEGQLGTSVALSSEGTYALLGGPGDNAEAGAAWVETRSGTAWSFQAKLTGKEENGAGHFGASVALSAEGTYALIGGPLDKSGLGAAWVETRSGTTWSYQAKLTGTSEVGNGEFGASVSLAAKTGEYALIGGPADSSGAGAAWVQIRSGTTWSFQAKLTGKEGVGNGEFGASVAMSQEGKDALVGGPADNGGVGGAWVSTRSGTAWTQQGPKLTGKEEVGEGEVPGAGRFGYSVALSPDGNTALIGGPSDNNGTGAAWVFTRASEKWTQQGAKLTGNEESGAGEFGRSVALSETGTYAVIGGPRDNEKAGAAWVFLRSGEKWTQQGPKLTGKEEVGAGEFGRSVAVASKEGNYALIGGPSDSTNAGAGWVFLRSGTTWSFQAKLTGKEEVGEGQFGTSVALSSEGTYALLGGPADKEEAGAAWVETRSGTAWSFQAKLTGKEENGKARFGTSVALSAEATYALIGGPDDKEALGAAWVETRSGTTWSYQAKLTGTSEVGNGEFGASVALAAKTGEYALIGGPADSTKVGAAWVEIRSGTTWSFQAKLTGVAETGKGEFGASVAMSSEGKDSLIGAPSDRRNIGGAWVFTRSGTAWTQQGEKLTGGGESGSGESGGKGQFGYSVAISSEGNTALIGGPETLHSGAAWVFTRSGATWTQQGTKIVPTAAEQSPPDGFGSSLALSSDGNTALIGAPDDNSAVGAAWVFTRSGEKWTQQGTKITGGGAVGAGHFGASVALSSDGNTALIGGPTDGSFATGDTWVFTRASEKWTQQSELNGATANGRFGEAVALSANGNTALIGEPLANGAARVFTRSGSSWFQQGSALTGKEEIGEAEFGDAVALSADGNTALIGGPLDNVGAGATWAFTRSGEAWTQQGAKLTGKEGIGEGQFGTGVALSSDGNTALIGGPADNAHLGAAWVETRSGTSWSQLGGKLTAKEEVGEGEFGTSVALSAEGNYALIGGFTDSHNVGAAWVFLQNQPTPTTGAASSVAQTTATLNATVNPNGANVTECKFEYGTTEAYGSNASCASLPGSGTSPVAVSASLSVLAANTTYHFRISASSANGTSKGADKTFKTLPNVPTVKTEAASGVASTSATLNATVNPNGGEVSECTLEYGTTTSYGSAAACTPSPGGGTSPVAVSAVVSGLTPNTTYHFRISATNAGGTSKGLDETLKTLPNAPIVKTEAASSITKTSATLNATVNPNGSNVSECKLEYGTTTSYGSSAACTPSPGSGESAVSVSAAVSGLSANTTYHFRISATSAGGTSTGADQNFTTALPNAPSVKTEAASSVTKTSATLNAMVNPNGGNVTECTFQYGETVVYYLTAPCTPSPGSGNSPVFVSATITGLTPNTTYHFRIVATNAGGTGEGADETLKTLPNAPTVKTEAASSIGSASATLNATVNPNGGNVSECTLEYGTTTSYGSTATCTPSPGSGTSVVAVSASVSGLSPLTTYHFRISATNAGGTSNGSDETLKTLPNAPTVKTEAASSITKTSATLNATVNPNSGNVTECTFEYGPTTSYGSTASCASLPGSGSSPVAVSASVSGLLPFVTYHYRISATNAGGASKGEDQSFKTALPDPPTVKTEPASSITKTSATLNATVNPNGGEVSECKLEYGTTTSYGSSANCTPSPGSGASAVAVSAAVSGLTPNTTYHFRISATNAGGTSNGADETLKTLPNAPTVKTEAVSSVGSTTATLNATVNPNGGNVSECKFEYGTTEAYGSSAPCSSLPGSGTSPVAVSAAVSGLAPLTTYHVRISATNAGGTSKGADETLKTLPSAPTVKTEAASSIAKTTATLNATVNPNSGNVTECKFEYGTTEAYGSSAPCSSLPGSGSSPVAVSASVSGLAPITKYHFRISATNAGGTSTGADLTFKTALPNVPTVVTEAPSGATQTSVTVHGTVNPNGGNVSECIFEYGETVVYYLTVPCTPPPGSGNSPVAVSATITGLSPNTTYHYRISATNAGGTSEGADESLKTLPNAPTVKTEAPTSIAPTGATLKATVNPNGGNVSECKLEYGTTTAYGLSAPCTPSPGSGESPVAVSASVTGLSASTNYHFRVSATNAGGTSLGEDKSFTTLAPNPPTVTTTAATSLTRTLATLNGTVNPNATTVSDCHFEYGTTTSYGSTVPCASLPGSGESAVAVTASLGNLSPATTYHFRLSATNAGGTSPGSDQSFTTLTALPTPHWYKNGAKIALGEKSPMIGWGTLTLESSAGTATCRTAQAANVENSAAAATKEVVLFAAFECKPIGGSCSAGEQRATPRHLPWRGTMLEEGEEGSETFREEGWGIEINLECFKGGVNTGNQLFKTGPVLSEVGTSTPAWPNGTSATNPSQVSFDTASGHLYAEVEGAAVKGTTKGKLRFVGYQDIGAVPLITLAKP